MTGLPVLKVTPEAFTNRPPQRWVLQGLLPAGITLLVARPKVGKTIFLTQLAQAVQDGSDFLGLHSEANDVLYLDFESSQTMFMERAVGALQGQLPTFECFLGGDLRGPAFKAALIDHLSQLRPGALVIADTLYRLLFYLLIDPEGRGSSSGGYKAMTQALGELRDISRRVAANVGEAPNWVICHHGRKGQSRTLAEGEWPSADDAIGSTALVGGVDAIIAMGLVNSDDNILRARLTVEGRAVSDIRLELVASYGPDYVGKVCNGELLPFRAWRLDLDSARVTERRREALDQRPDTVRGRVEKTLRMAGGPVSVETLCERVGAPKRQVQNALTALRKDRTALNSADAKYTQLGAGQWVHVKNDLHPRVPIGEAVTPADKPDLIGTPENSPYWQTQGQEMAETPVELYAGNSRTTRGGSK